jgi:hypothetical protein
VPCFFLDLPVTGVLGSTFFASSSTSLLVPETSDASAAIAAEARVPRGSFITIELLSGFGFGRSEGGICDMFIYVFLLARDRKKWGHVGGKSNLAGRLQSFLSQFLGAVFAR